MMFWGVNARIVRASSFLSQPPSRLFSQRDAGSRHLAGSSAAVD